MSHPACPNCNQNGNVIKSGQNRSGSQRYRCQLCCRYFTPLTTSKDDEQLSKTKEEALKLFMAGYSMRHIGRIFGVHHQTVKWWIITSADKYNKDSEFSDKERKLLMKGINFPLSKYHYRKE